MPLNTLRLNHAPSSHPNDRIVFIKPLPRPPSEQASYDTADTFLRAIAAQCLPIMKKHYLSVTTLEEYEPNPEFIGRNFNNGEIIQLVLRSKSGGWVGFQMVQMVMMHELAHNMHMNHGKGFWETRNLFSKEMKELWDKNYSGEGFWGGGRVLGDLSKAMGSNTMPSEELADLQICGGTFRSRRRKRKNVGDGGRELTWKEKKDRRIERKFGKNGQSLGEDENARLLLEIGTRGPLGVKPRVAGSQRGRELRAAAALARFGTNKKEAEDVKKEVEVEEDENDKDYEEVGDPAEDVKDFNGQRMLDGFGFGMIRVCDDEDGSTDEAQVKQEMAELEGLDHHRRPPKTPILSEKTSAPIAQPSAGPAATAKKTRNPIYDIPEYCGSPEAVDAISETMVNCQICSMSNERLSATCLVCANVLDPDKDSRHWQCKSETCRGSPYINAGDCGLCGVCGARRPS